MTLKKVFAWLHLWLGLVVGLIFSVAAFTGALLIFEEELEEVCYPRLYDAAGGQVGKAKLSLDQLRSFAGQYAGKQPLARMVIDGSDSTRNVIFQTEGSRMERVFIGVDPYTGALRGRVAGNRHLFSVAEEIHRRLLLGDIGKAITGVCCIAYLVVLITGLVIWWPKNKKVGRQRLKIKWNASGKRLNWDVHAVGGFYFFPILFVITLTGLTWSYKWFNNGIYFLFDGKGPVKTDEVYDLPVVREERSVLEKAYRQAQKLLPYPGTVTINFPEEEEAAVVEVSKEREDAAVPNVVDRLFFSAHSGALLRQELYADQTRGAKVRRMMFPVHTGSIGGLATKFLYLIVVLYAATLPFTGLYIWLGRKKKKKPASAFGRPKK